MSKRPLFDKPPNSLKDSNANPKMKTTEHGIKTCYLVCNTYGVRGSCWNFGMGTMINDKCVNYSYKYAQTKQ